MAVTMDKKLLKLETAK